MIWEEHWDRHTGTWWTLHDDSVKATVVERCPSGRGWRWEVHRAGGASCARGFRAEAAEAKADAERHVRQLLGEAKR